MANHSPQPTVATDQLIVDTLRKALPSLHAVYRYGSAGSVYARPESDIDLAVLADMPVDVMMLIKLAAELAGYVGHEIDLNDMRRLPVTLRVQIVTQGRRLFVANRAAVDEYDSRVLSDYAYLNEARRGILDDMRMRGNIYG